MQTLWKPALIDPDTESLTRLQLDPKIELQLKLAARAAGGDATARESVNSLVWPVIDFQTDRFCKRFCKENRRLYRCTLSSPWGTADRDASLCEWGNASYGWMLDDLTSSKRLNSYQGRDGSTLYNYLYRIANSLPFYERWKDWRFGRKVHVPTYVQQIAPLASRVFLLLRSDQDIGHIAQALAISEEAVADICHRIIIELTRRNRLYLLDADVTVSLTGKHDDAGTETEQQSDIASHDEPAESIEQRQQLHDAWYALTPAEQYVMESLVIEDQDAETVLAALDRMNISIKSGVPASQTDRQQLYYFKRKTLSRLADLMTSQGDS